MEDILLFLMQLEEEIPPAPNTHHCIHRLLVDGKEKLALQVNHNGELKTLCFDDPDEFLVYGADSVISSIKSMLEIK